MLWIGISCHFSGFTAQKGYVETLKSIKGFRELVCFRLYFMHGVRAQTDRTCMGNGMTERVLLLLPLPPLLLLLLLPLFAVWCSDTLQGTWRNLLQIPQSPPHSLQHYCTFRSTIQLFGVYAARVFCNWVKGRWISTLIRVSDGMLRIQLTWSGQRGTETTCCDKRRC